MPTPYFRTDVVHREGERTYSKVPVIPRVFYNTLVWIRHAHNIGHVRLHLLSQNSKFQNDQNEQNLVASTIDSNLSQTLFPPPPPKKRRSTLRRALLSCTGTEVLGFFVRVCWKSSSSNINFWHAYQHATCVEKFWWTILKFCL